MSRITDAESAILARLFALGYRVNQTFTLEHVFPVFDAHDREQRAQVRMMAGPGGLLILEQDRDTRAPVYRIHPGAHDAYLSHHGMIGETRIIEALPSARHERPSKELLLWQMEQALVSMASALTATEQAQRLLELADRITSSATFDAYVAVLRDLLDQADEAKDYVKGGALD